MREAPPAEVAAGWMAAMRRGDWEKARRQTDRIELPRRARQGRPGLRFIGQAAVIRFLAVNGLLRWLHRSVDLIGQDDSSGRCILAMISAIVAHLPRA